MDSTIADLEQAVELNLALWAQLDPTIAAAHVSRGNARLARRDYSGAAADFNRAIWRDPNSATARSRLSAVQASIDSTVRAFERLVDEFVEEQRRANRRVEIRDCFSASSTMRSTTIYGDSDRVQSVFAQIAMLFRNHPVL